MRPTIIASLMPCLALLLSSCSTERAAATVPVVAVAAVSGERLAYLSGCVNCHHQTPKEILNAPSLMVVQVYSLPEFRALLKTGVTRDGRDLYAQGSIMGIVAREQLAYFTDDEVAAVHTFLQKDWSAERAAREDAKIALFPPPTFMTK